MTRPSLKSRFGEQIRAFVGYKNSLGFPYDESIRILGRFDDFCVERFPEKDCLDCELALAWLEKRDTENTAGHRNRIMVIREFAKYLRAVGTEAYMIPISMTSKGPGYVPHIFNEAEIKAFFHGADSFRPHGKAPARHLVIPVFYRLLYCCGLRPAEARLLKKENVDLVRGSVYVVESKGHKDRVVAVADDLLQIMRSYSTLISEIYPDSDYFFPRYDGDGPYTKRWTEEMFWRCFSMAGITAFEGPKPRVYDFRHTFATECICRWMRETQVQRLSAAEQPARELQVRGRGVQHHRRRSCHFSTGLCCPYDRNRAVAGRTVHAPHGLGRLDGGPYAHRQRNPCG